MANEPISGLSALGAAPAVDDELEILDRSDTVSMSSAEGANKRITITQLFTSAKFTTLLAPISNDGASLGSTALQFSDLFLAEGGVINWDNGDVTITQTGNVLSFAGASTRYEFDAVIAPTSSDGAALGTSALMFSDLFLASGAVINFNNGDVTITHGSNTITIAGGELILPTDGPTSTLGAGFRGAPQNSQTAAYTTVLADAGKCIFHPASDNNARTFTIDSNANVAFPVGTIIEFINMAAASVTIAITSDTMTLLPAGTTGSRTLAQYGRASAEKISSTAWIISGNSALT